MTGAADDLYSEIQKLAEAIGRLSSHGVALIFGVCGRALAPLLELVEQRSDGSWTVPDFALALDLIEAFAIGSTEAADYDELRTRLRVTVPGEHPWSTFGQDALACADAGLAAASVGDHPNPLLIHFALEPTMAWMQNRDVEVIRTYGDNYWSREVVKDPAMAVALQFLRGLVAKASQVAPVSSYDFAELVRDAAALRAAISVNGTSNQ